MPDFSVLVNLLQLAVKDRTQLALENIALRHKLAVCKRRIKRPDINDGNAPIARRVQAAGEVIATPVLGGLHHRYSRAA